jgi:adenylate kinase
MKALKIVAVFGISGVGKSWLVHQVASRLPGALHLQGSTLIKQGLADPAVSSEELRRASGDEIIANQKVLIAMFNRALSEHIGNLVLFDGHLLIDTEHSLVEVPQSAVAALHPTLLVHVEADPMLIAARRHDDKTRARPKRDIATLAEHQTRSRDLCQAYAQALSILVNVVTSGDVDSLAASCQ